MAEFEEIISQSVFSQWLGGPYKCLPLIQKITLDSFDLHSFYEGLPEDQNILLESGKITSENNFSIIGVRASDFFFVKDNKVFQKNKSYESSQHLNELKRLIDDWKGPSLDFLVSLPLYSGCLGFFSYESSRYFDSVKFNSFHKNHDFLDYGVWFYDKIILFDHDKKILYLCATASSYAEAQLKIKSLKDDVTYSLEIKRKSRASGKSSELESNFTYQKYIQTIEKCRDYIKRGHSYQINLAQELKCQTELLPWDIYKNLLKINPVSYASYFKIDNFHVICGSPERLVKLKGDKLYTRPIAGTRKRGKTEVEDFKFKKELQTDSKEKAEHAMLVDLMRNDLGKISKKNSVTVSSYADIVDYTHVMHLESDVISIVREDVHPLDVVGAVFPGGTVTGVPKLRTMEIIDELELSPRNLYTGTIGYISCTHELEFNIVIRSIIYNNSQVSFHVGGGLTYDCVAKREYKETLNKARSQLAAIGIEHGSIKK